MIPDGQNYNSYKTASVVQVESCDPSLNRTFRNCFRKINTAAEVVYPANWAWRPFALGEGLSVLFNPVLVCLSYAVTIVGSWTSLILLEHVAIHTSVDRTNPYIWLMLSCIACAIGSSWPHNLLLLASISFEDSANIDIRYNMVYLITCVPVLVLGYFFAFLLGKMSMRVTVGQHYNANNSCVNSWSGDKDQTGTGVESEKAKKKGDVQLTKAGAINTSQATRQGSAHARHVSTMSNNHMSSSAHDAAEIPMSAVIRQVHSWLYLLLSALLLTACLSAQSLLSLLAIDTPTPSSFVVWGTIISACIGLLFFPFACFWFFHVFNPLLRPIGAILMSLGQFGMSFSFGTVAVRFSYVDVEPHYSSASTTSDFLIVVALLNCVVVCLILFALNVQRLSLSKTVLIGAARSWQHKYDRLTIEHAEMAVSHARARRQLEMINMCRPLTRPSHYALPKINIHGSTKRHPSDYGWVNPVDAQGKDSVRSSPKDSTGLSESTPPKLSPVPTEPQTPSARINIPSPPHSASPNRSSRVFPSPSAVMDSFHAHTRPRHGSHTTTSMLDMPDFRPSLGHLLEHPVTAEFVKDALSTNSCAELALFYLEVQAYSKISEEHVRKARAHEIVSAFIGDDAENEVNISAEQVNVIKTRVEKGDYGKLIFEEASQEVLKLIETNMIKFKESMEYEVCVKILNAEKAAVAAATPPEGYD